MRCEKIITASFERTGFTSDVEFISPSKEIFLPCFGIPQYDSFNSAANLSTSVKEAKASLKNILSKTTSPKSIADFIILFSVPVLSGRRESIGLSSSPKVEPYCVSISIDFDERHNPQVKPSGVLRVISKSKSASSAFQISERWCRTRCANETMLSLICKRISALFESSLERHERSALSIKAFFFLSSGLNVRFSSFFIEPPLKCSSIHHSLIGLTILLSELTLEK